MGFFSGLDELLRSYQKYDPATESYVEVLFLYPGVRAWVLHYFAHRLYKWKWPLIPRALTELGRLLSGIDIHPGAKIGQRVIMDHGMGIVIGQTAEVGDDVLIYQGVTLGGTSLLQGKRHPTIMSHCVVGAGAKILGDIVVGRGSRIGANSVVVKDVPEDSTVVGIPAKLVARGGVQEGQELEHARLPDPISDKLNSLQQRIEDLERALKNTEAGS